MCGWRVGLSLRLAGELQPTALAAAPGQEAVL